jgi:molecular chaperone DnaJ
MPVMRSRQSGDMYVQIVLETQQILQRRQRENLEEFECVPTRKTTQNQAGFFSKVKDFSVRSERSKATELSLPPH